MSYLCLDLSLKSTGYSIFNGNGILIDHHRVVPQTALSISGKIFFIASRIKKLYKQVDNLVIEDVYLGITGVVNLVKLSRLAGGIIYSWKSVHKEDPLFLSATHARKLVRLKGNCQKAEVQTFILKKYKFAGDRLINKYEYEIDELLEEKVLIRQEKPLTVEDKKIKKKKLSKIKYRFDKLSKLIETETGYGEDVCDSILIGLAYYEEKNG